jgi:thioesterase domain-containing protein
MRRKFYTVLQAGKKSLKVVPEKTRMVPLQSAGGRPPFFMIDSYPYFIDVVKLLGPDQPVTSLIGHEDMLMANRYSIAEEAAQHVRTMLEQQPEGPLLVGGCSASGIVAYEIAQQMSALGRPISLLVLFDTHNVRYMREYSRLWMSLHSYRDDLRRIRKREIPQWIEMKIRKLIMKVTTRLSGVAQDSSRSHRQLGPSDVRIERARKYRPTPYSGRVLLFKRHRELTGRYRDKHYGWGHMVEHLEVCSVSAIGHSDIFKSELDRAVVTNKLRDEFNNVVSTSARSSKDRELMLEREKASRVMEYVDAKRIGKVNG